MMVFFIKLKHVGECCVQWLYLLVFIYSHIGMSHVKKQRMLDRKRNSTREMRMRLICGTSFCGLIVIRFLCVLDLLFSESDRWWLV